MRKKNNDVKQVTKEKGQREERWKLEQDGICIQLWCSKFYERWYDEGTANV